MQLVSYSIAIVILRTSPMFNAVLCAFPFYHLSFMTEILVAPHVGEHSVRLCCLV